MQINRRFRGRVGQLLRIALVCASATPALARPSVWMLPPPGNNGQDLRELMADPGAWQQTRARIDGIGYADHWLNSQFTGAERTSYFATIARLHLKLALEVGALKPWGPTADQAFAADRRKWDKFISEGAHIDTIAMDEPFAYSTISMQQPVSFAAGQTSRFIALARRAEPGARIGDTEPYPGLPTQDMLAFIDEVQRQLANLHVRGMDFFRLDVNWMHFRPGDPLGVDGWAGVRNLEAECHRRGIPFSMIYWAADFPSLARAGDATDETWETGIMRQGAAYAAAGGAPDEMVIDSWLDTPIHAVPETAPGVLTRSVLDFANRFAPGTSSVR